MNEDRNMGIDLFRIVATFCIMVLHVMGQGGVLDHLAPASFRYGTGWLLETLCYYSGAVYGLITGYVCAERRFRISNLAYVALTVWFYTFIMTFLFAVIMPGSIGRTELLAMAFPAMTEQYWYYTAYVGMFFFIPMMNHAIITFYKRYVHLTLIAFVLIFSVFPVFFSTDVFGLRGGLSFVCIMLCYFIGAYLKHFDILKKLSNAKLLMLYAVSVLLTLCFKLIVEAMAGMGSYDSGQSMRLYAYNSPTILVSSIALLAVFSRLEIKKRGAVLFIKAVSPLTFGIYLVNCHPLIWRYFMKDRFAGLASYPALVMVVFVLLSALLLFIAGAGIDAIRHLIFETGGLRKKLRKAEEKFFEKADSMP